MLGRVQRRLLGDREIGAGAGEGVHPATLRGIRERRMEFSP